MISQPDQNPELKFVVTNTLIVGDIKRSVAFYRDILGARVLREGEPTFLRLGNMWLTINRGGGPTDDKPEVMASPPRDPNVLSIFLNLRVIDIRRCYNLWSSRGANFITEPKVHATELRCYMRDPDGHLIEVGQTPMTAGPLDLYAYLLVNWGLPHGPPSVPNFDDVGPDFHSKSSKAATRRVRNRWRLRSGLVHPVIVPMCDNYLGGVEPVEQQE